MKRRGLAGQALPRGAPEAVISVLTLEVGAARATVDTLPPRNLEDLRLLFSPGGWLGRKLRNLSCC